MDIVVCGAQVPFMYGGAEQLMENLVAALRAAGHRAELVRLPAAWERERLFDSAMAWRLVPVDAEVVIATNFPSYFVRHPRKVVWLLHQHRGAYDAADSPISDFTLDADGLEEQRLLAQWDSVALGEARAIFTISQLVTDRLARFNGLASTPLYHPAPLHERISPGPSGGYVLAVNRLERNKRPDLIVQAFASVPAPARLVMVGEGTMSADLRAMAARLGIDDRVEWRGRVGDDELVRLLAAAAAVVYVPFEEDYGYVTLQAFLASKPVVTTSDAGGVLEWVRDGETGVVAPPEPAALGRAMQQVLDDRGLAERFGGAGRDLVAGLAWGPVVDALVGASGAGEAR